MGGVLRDQAGPCQNILEPLTAIHPTKLIFNKQLSQHPCVSEACVVRVGVASEGAAGAISGYGNWLKEAWRETAQGEGVERTPDAQVLVLALPLTACETRGRSLPQSGLQSSRLWNESAGPTQLGGLGEEGVLTGATREPCGGLQKAAPSSRCSWRPDTHGEAWHDMEASCSVCSCDLGATPGGQRLRCLYSCFTDGGSEVRSRLSWLQDAVLFLRCHGGGCLLAQRQLTREWRRVPGLCIARHRAPRPVCSANSSWW